jgi:hypothetical protein
MNKLGQIAVLITAAMALGACQSTQNSTGSTALDASTASGAPLGAPTAPVNNGTSGSTLTAAQLDTSQPGKPTGTLVGQRVIQFRDDLTKLQQGVQEQATRHQQLRQDAESNAGGYQTTVGAINAKLQLGTTRGNPGVIKAWRQAESQLRGVETDVAQMNLLANDAANNASFASYLLDSIRAAYTASGAVDEDHRQLRILEDSTQQTAVSIDRLLNQLSDDINRQNRFLGIERSNLTQLSLAVNNGEFYGSSLASRTEPTPAPVAQPGTGISSGRPLVVIRFDRSTVNYEQALYEAASKALERRPNAGFDLVAVAPANGSPAEVALNSDIARTNANKVMRSLLTMGLPADRVSVTQVTDPNVPTNEVQIYVR